MFISKSARLAEFLDRLAKAQPCSTKMAALQLIAKTLNDVEDQLSGVLNQPDNHRSDGRMYPPQEDAARAVEGRPELTRYRSRHHNVYVSDVGAILIVEGQNTLFAKPSSDTSEIIL